MQRGLWVLGDTQLSVYVRLDADFLITVSSGGFIRFLVEIGSKLFGRD
jgi:hypothetical protein